MPQMAQLLHQLLQSGVHRRECLHRPIRHSSCEPSWMAWRSGCVPSIRPAMCVLFLTETLLCGAAAICGPCKSSINRHHAACMALQASAGCLCFDQACKVTHLRCNLQVSNLTSHMDGMSHASDEVKDTKRKLAAFQTRAQSIADAWPEVAASPEAIKVCLPASHSQC